MLKVSLVCVSVEDEEECLKIRALGDIQEERLQVVLGMLLKEHVGFCVNRSISVRLGEDHPFKAVGH